MLIETGGPVENVVLTRQDVPSLVAYLDLSPPVMSGRLDLNQ